MDLSRWVRQINIPQFSLEKQLKLKNSKTVVFGVGGIGCPAALYLTAAGIGELLLVDHDTVEMTNLNRQILFNSSDIGRTKTKTAMRKLSLLDPGIKITAMVQKVDRENIYSLISNADIVLDCLDQNRDRLIVNDACVQKKIPAIHGFAQDFNGQLLAVIPGRGPCLRCVMDESFPEKDETPAIGVATGMIGVAMATQAILILTGLGHMENKRLIYDLIFSEIIKIPVEKNILCPVCSNSSNHPCCTLR